MKYKFEVTYIPEYLMNANKHMNELHPDFGKIAMRTMIEISHNEEKTIDEIKQNIMWAFQKDKCKVFKIEGGTVE